MQNQEKVPNYSVANVTKDAFTVTTYRSTDDSVVDTITIKKSKNGWETVDGKDYWYEDGVKQGTEGRGKEIYDPESDAWYWLDSDANGAKAVSRTFTRNPMAANGSAMTKTARWSRDGTPTRTAPTTLTPSLAQWQRVMLRSTACHAALTKPPALV